MLKTASLTPLQHAVIIEKATEQPFSGDYSATEVSGSYLCRNCGVALFRDYNKFHSGCGWASFDNALNGALKLLADADGRRTEIVCAGCNAHLGHVFNGEGFTPLNTRHCVNSAALDFVSATQVVTTAEIILAAGCFWGVEYYLRQLDGVVLTQVGYCGGIKDYPTYAEVCTETSGHLEVVRVIFDTAKLDLAQILKCFFEIHDPTQTTGQGPDIGQQYLSAVFCYTDEQRQITRNIIQLLETKGFVVATTVRNMATFWIGEEYHRNYYQRHGSLPYCHGYSPRF